MKALRDKESEKAAKKTQQKVKKCKKFLVFNDDTDDDMTVN